MKILLAGPGTGKTTKIKQLMKERNNLDEILILSFTNATINDLLSSFERDKIDITRKNCMTLHRYALILNHQTDLYVLNGNETDLIKMCSRKIGIDFPLLCKMLGCVTFQNMIVDTINFIKINPEYIKEKIGNKKLLIVDEYQDFNDIEQELIQLLLHNIEHTIILGDDNQCIYGFKDATADGIINFYKSDETENIKHDNVCYRCPDTIVNVCTNLIVNNKKRIEKQWKCNNKRGEVIFKQSRTQNETSQFVINEIKKIRRNEPNSTIMVLSSVKFAVRYFIESLKGIDIDIVNFWVEKISIDTLKKIWEIKFLYGAKKLLPLIFLILKGNNTPYKKNKFIEKFKEIIEEDLSFDKIYKYTKEKKLIDSKVINWFEEKKDFIELISNDYNEFFNIYENNKEMDFFVFINKLYFLLCDNPIFDKNSINVMSIHKSKGLQADYVFVLGLVEGIIPNKMRGIDSIEMQRRLLFVAMSRTEKNLYLLSTMEWEGSDIHTVDKDQFKFNFINKKWIGKTSSFINELKIL